MALDAKLVRRLTQELDPPRAEPATGFRGARLVDDGRRLFRRAMRLVSQGVVVRDALDIDALELSCLAMQLPLCQRETLAAGRMGLVSLRDRAEQAAELLVTTVSDDIDETLLDRATRLLHETPQRPPVLDEAKLLADVVGLDDFGVSGILRTLIRLTLSGQGLDQLQDAIAKREQYGYYEARLKDSFNFEPARELARLRLEQARATARKLAAELDEPWS